SAATMAATIDVVHSPWLFTYLPRIQSIAVASHPGRGHESKIATLELRVNGVPIPSARPIRPIRHPMHDPWRTFSGFHPSNDNQGEGCMKPTAQLVVILTVLIAGSAVASAASPDRCDLWHQRAEARREAREAMREAQRSIRDARREVYRARLDEQTAIRE